jgi:hypothetical protein
MFGLAHQCGLPNAAKAGLPYRRAVFRLLVALLAGRDLLLFAKYLFVPARTVVGRAAGIRGLCRRVPSGGGAPKARGVGAAGAVVFTRPRPNCDISWIEILQRSSLY